MPKPTFAPTYVPPGFYVDIQDISKPSLPPSNVIAAFIGQGSKTMNRVDELVKGVKNGQDGPLENDTVIDIVSVTDSDNVTYTRGVDFTVYRNAGHAYVDWSLKASLAATADLSALTPDLTALNGKYFNIVIDGGTPQSVQFSGLSGNTPADVSNFINAWDPSLVGVASIGTGNVLVLSANSVVVNEGSANTTLGYTTGQFATVQEPAVDKIYQAFYTSDKTAAEYAPQLMASVDKAVPTYGPVRTPEVLIDGNSPTAVGTKTLTDTGLTMTTDEHVGHYLKITSGPGKGQVRVIYANTPTQFSVSQDWTTGNVPDTTSTYQVTDINYNTIILGAKCYADLNGSLFIGSQTPDDIFDDNNEKAAITALERDIQGTNPSLLVFMRGLGSTDAASVAAYLSAHVKKMSDVLHNKFRGCVIGMAQNITNPTTYTQLATGIANRRMILVAPGQVSKDFGQGLVSLDGSFVAAGLAGVYCDNTVDGGEPIFGKPLGACFDVGSFSDPFLEIEKNLMAAAGVCIIERQGTDLVVRDDLTTDQSTDFSSGIKFLRESDGIATQVRKQMSQTLKGKRFSSDIASLADAQFTVVLNSYMIPQTNKPQIDRVENKVVEQNATQHQQLDFKADIYLVGDVKWEYALLGFGV